MSWFEESARVFATFKHTGQVRKYTGEPYINHPAAVADLVRSSAGSTEEMVAAAWLHDVVEDCGVSIEEIEGRFGRQVADLVSWLTDVSKPSDGNRAFRKTLDRLHIAKAPPEAKTIKLADLIDNSRSILERDPDFAKVYIEEKAALLKVLKEGDAVLYERACRIVAEASRAK